MAVDGGDHKISATARCYMRLERSVTVEPEHDHKAIAVDLQTIEDCPSAQKARPTVAAADEDVSRKAEPAEQGPVKAYDRSRFFVGPVEGGVSYDAGADMTRTSNRHGGVASGVEVGWHQHLGSGPLFLRTSAILKSSLDPFHGSYDNYLTYDAEADVRIGVAVARSRLFLSLGLAGGFFSGSWGNGGYVLPVKAEVAYDFTRWLELGFMVAIDTSPSPALAMVALRFHL